MFKDTELQKKLKLLELKLILLDSHIHHGLAAFCYPNVISSVDKEREAKADIASNQSAK